MIEYRFVLVDTGRAEHSVWLATRLVVVGQGRWVRGEGQPDRDKDGVAGSGCCRRKGRG